MVNCEICGKSGKLVTAIVSGVKMDVCETCSKHGKVLTKPIPPKIMLKKEFHAPKIEMPSTELVENYSAKIKNAREKMGLTQDEVGKKIAEKESLIQKLESGQVKPSDDVAKKLERFFGIKLLVELEEEKTPFRTQTSSGLTLGDFIKKKK